jgi:hypothetical protein
LTHQITALLRLLHYKLKTRILESIAYPIYLERVAQHCELRLVTLQKNDKNYLRKVSCFRRLSNQWCNTKAFLSNFLICYGLIIIICISDIFGTCCTALRVASSYSHQHKNLIWAQFVFNKTKFNVHVANILCRNRY